MFPSISHPTIRMVSPRSRRAAYAFLGALSLSVLTPGTARAQAPSTAGTTLEKLYTDAQATRGREGYLTYCASCHKTVEHAGPRFWPDKVGKTLGEFWGYLRSQMPQDNPGAMSAEAYADVIAFIMQMNKMPAGDIELPADSVALEKVRVVPPTDTLRSRNRR
ncbi:MAG: cytochrome c [Gemmatimonadetes bacterium]|nr:cytochrome c [Gemmatimonadota bacterium]